MQERVAVASRLSVPWILASWLRQDTDPCVRCILNPGLVSWLRQDTDPCILCILNPRLITRRNIKNSGCYQMWCAESQEETGCSTFSSGITEEFPLTTF